MKGKRVKIGATLRKTREAARIYVLRTNTDLCPPRMPHWPARGYGRWSGVSGRSRAPSRAGRTICPGKIGSRDTSPSASWCSVFRWRSFELFAWKSS